MEKFHKVILIMGCITSLGSGVISVIDNRFDTYAFISALLFFNLYIGLVSNLKLQNLIDGHIEEVKKILKK